MRNNLSKRFTFEVKELGVGGLWGPVGECCEMMVFIYSLTLGY